MDKPPSFSQFFNIAKKNDRMITALLNIRDFSSDPEAVRQATHALQECGVSSPAMPKDQMPLPAPGAVSVDGEPVEYGKEGDNERRE